MSATAQRPTLVALPPPSDGLPLLAKMPHRPLMPGDAREVQTLLHQIATEQMRAAQQMGDIQATQRDQGKQIDMLLAANVERDRKLAELKTDRQVFVIGIRALWIFLAGVFGIIAWLFGPPAAAWTRGHMGL